MKEAHIEKPCPSVAPKGLRRAWYAGGLRFRCRRCGNCCRGEPGYIWINQQEMQVTAKYLSLSLEEFGVGYLRKVGRRYSLLEYPQGDCIMYSQGCSIYTVRPRQCRTFPFWPSNLRSKEAWEALKEFCPGVDKGPLYTLVKIERLSCL